MAPTQKKTPAAKQPPAKKQSTKQAPAARKAAAKKKAPAAGKKRTGARRPLTAKRRTAARKPAARATKRAPRPLKENAEALALARTIAHAAQGKKAKEVLILDVRRRGASVGYDYVVLASGDTDRQLGAIAEGVEDATRPQGRRPTSTESAPEWVLMNYDDVVAHFFTPEKRGLYDIEGLWVDAPRVRLS